MLKSGSVDSVRVNGLQSTLQNFKQLLIFISLCLEQKYNIINMNVLKHACNFKFFGSFSDYKKLNFSEEMFFITLEFCMINLKRGVNPI